MTALHIAALVQKSVHRIFDEVFAHHFRVYMIRIFLIKDPAVNATSETVHESVRVFCRIGVAVMGPVEGGPPFW